LFPADLVELHLTKSAVINIISAISGLILP
jgi:hypothetical protein